MTEDEATKKWCPLARAPGTMIEPSPDGKTDNRIGVTQNRGYQMGGPLSNCMCIGSRCMAWRFDRYNQNPDGKARGYCGAVGKPD
jgi:hypothetical protein